CLITLPDRTVPYTLYFFFTDTAPTEISTLSLHDALPILLAQALGEANPGDPTVSAVQQHLAPLLAALPDLGLSPPDLVSATVFRSEEHTSELQSLRHLVCRLLLEKKKKQQHLLLHIMSTY